MSEDANLTQTEETSTVEDSPSAALSTKKDDSTSEANQTVDTNSEGAGEYDWVPEVFMKDGQPDFQNLAKSYKELQTEFRTKRGAESVEDYSYELKNGELFQEQMLPQLKETALEWGLSGEQFGNVAGLVDQIAADMQTVFTDQMNEQFGTAERTEATLQEAWGDNFAANMQNVDKAWNAYKPQGVSADSFTNDPVVYQILANIGAELGEDKITGRGDGYDTSVPEMSEINELMARDDYWDQSSGVADKVARMLQQRVDAGLTT